MELDQLRKDVESVDADILRLFAKRQDIVRRIGAFKAEKNLSVRNARVEDAVLNRNQSLGEQLGLDADAVAQLTDVLVNHSVKEQIRIYAQKSAPVSASLRRIAVIGAAGGMGQFFCRELSSAGFEILAVDPNLNGGASIEQACAGGDVILLASPLRSTGEVIRQIVACGTSALLVDMCSIKHSIMPFIKECEHAGIPFLSTHPMFGPSAGDLVGRIVLYDLAHSGDRGQAFLDALVQRGAQLVHVPVAHHDGMITYSLGLPHLLNFLFGKLIERSGFSARQLMAITGTTFQRQYSVANQVVHQPSNLYRDIQAMNPHTGELLASLSRSVSEFSNVLASDADFEAWLRDVTKFFDQP